MLTRITSLALFALASFLSVGLAAPQVDNILIGFRSVPKADADQYNKDGTIKGRPGGKSGQVGNGLYLSQGPRDQPGP